MQNISQQFLLDSSITYLNFGSFGACPRPVFEDYQKWQLELEREPVQFITVNSLRYLQQSREALGHYIGCDADDVVYFPNPSHAVNMVAKSLGLKPGDEVLTTNLEYGACDKAWNYYCGRAGAGYIRQEITLPLTTKEKFVEDFFKGLSPRTRMVFISHITSATALVLPVKEICEAAKQKGLITFVDGAHAPGHVALNLRELKADIYTGACHKWMLTPKGCSFIYVKKELQSLFDPLVVSWGYDSPSSLSSRFIDYHQGQGTRDVSAFLTVPKAIAFLNEHRWGEVSANCKALVRQNAQRFCDLFGTAPLCPVSDEFLGQMFSIPIHAPEPERLQRHLFEHHRIEVPLMRQGNSVYMRYSINAFNSQEDLDRLYHAAKALKGVWIDE